MGSFESCDTHLNLELEIYLVLASSSLGLFCREMDSCFASLKVSAAPVPGGGILNGSEFWGENLRVGLINKQFGAQLCKSLRSETRIGRVKPGIAYSVFTSDFDKQTLVCWMLHFSASFLLSYGSV